jgi:hypothetical protein
LQYWGHNTAQVRSAAALLIQLWPARLPGATFSLSSHLFSSLPTHYLLASLLTASSHHLPSICRTCLPRALVGSSCNNLLTSRLYTPAEASPPCPCPHQLAWPLCLLLQLTVGLHVCPAEDTVIRLVSLAQQGGVPFNALLPRSRDAHPPPLSSMDAAEQLLLTAPESAEAAAAGPCDEITPAAAPVLLSENQAASGSPRRGTCTSVHEGTVPEGATLPLAMPAVLIAGRGGRSVVGQPGKARQSGTGDGWRLGLDSALPGWGGCGMGSSAMAT